MELTDFGKFFGTEEQCVEYFREKKERNLICPECGHKQFYWLRGKRMHQCKHCGKRIGLKVGTVMQHSRLEYQVWMYAIVLLTLSSRQPSAKSVQRYLADNYQHKRYQPAWELLHKLRDIMGKHEEVKKLSGEVEIDEAFFTTSTPDLLIPGKLKRGAGSQRKAKVVVIAESLTPDPMKLGINTLKKRKRFRRALGKVRMVVVPNLKQDTVYRQVCKHVEKGSTIYTDASKSHSLFSKKFTHVSQVVLPEVAGLLLPWVHICISNFKRELDDVYHGFRTSYLQYYLNSCSYRLNRRKRSNKDNVEAFSYVATHTRTTYKHQRYTAIRNLELTPVDIAS